MTKPLTYRKPSGEWGVEGVDLSTLPPPVYGALAKLMRLEHPAGEEAAPHGDCAEWQNWLKDRFERGEA